MSVKVNLLPREVEERVVTRRITTYTGLGVGVWVLVLVLLLMLKIADVNAARDDRDAAQAEVTQLQVRVAELEQFRQLAEELEARNDVLAVAMAEEVSWSRVLNDLSLTFPANSSLVTLSAAAAGATGVDAAGGPSAEGAIGTLQFTGYSVEEYAPGVESVLIEFDKVRSFFNVFLATAAQEEIGTTEVTNFEGNVQLDEDAYTRRYADGLPPEGGR